jgi:hypothetical protein
LVALREVGVARVARAGVAAKEKAGAAKGVVLGATMVARGAEVKGVAPEVAAAVKAEAVKVVETVVAMGVAAGTVVAAAKTVAAAKAEATWKVVDEGGEVEATAAAGAGQPGLGAAVTFVVQGEEMQWRRLDCTCHNLHHHSSTPPSCTGYRSSSQRARPRGR